MRTLPLLAVLLAAVPASAQFTMPDTSAIKAGAQDLAKRKAQQAAAAQAAAAQKKTIRLDESYSALVERLIKDGDLGGREDGGAIHAFTKQDHPAANAQRTVTVGVVEAAPAENEGQLGGPDSMYRDLLERHTYTHLEAQVMTITIDPAKKTATVENRIYRVSLGGAVIDCLSQKGSAPIGADGTAAIGALDSKKLSAAEAGPGWQALQPELLRMYKVISI